MPITPTPHIWMNGEMVPWEDAKIHVLTHTLHYGTGVFEGIRAYETADGPGHLPTDRTHRTALQLGARSSTCRCPTRCREIVAGLQGRRRRQRARRRATSARSPTTATARWGSPPATAPPTSRSRRGPGAPISATTPSPRACVLKISSWTAPRPQHHAAGVEDHRQLRQLDARQDGGHPRRLRRGRSCSTTPVS